MKKKRYLAGLDIIEDDRTVICNRYMGLSGVYDYLMGGLDWEKFHAAIAKEIAAIKTEHPGAANFCLNLEDGDNSINFTRPLSEREAKAYDAILLKQKEAEEKAQQRADAKKEKEVLAYLKRNPQIIDKVKR